ncbi:MULTISPECIES: transglutaminase-like domain-containing protein [Bifidobacterium]|uniref:transglutaminase-like domain-containing protein n=1 Tax=Bifidobacterium TaxID=1678 RepID=UPI001BDC1233|nr:MULTISPECIES: transglutaminase-like domain-containing protein [Bifidobacterium]MBT1161536.1 transglutaminase domain-containing protein [Bifidobacterium sp. SO1]MBW3078912.1 transglutaminase domain-containing protein [Bifidobacterium simiiventris]
MNVCDRSSLQASWPKHMRLARASCFPLTVAVLTLVSASNLIDVYGSVGIWAMASIPSTLLGLVASSLWRSAHCETGHVGTHTAGAHTSSRFRNHPWVGLAVLVAAQLIIGPLLAVASEDVRATPSFTSLVFSLVDGWKGAFGSFSYIISVTPPTGTSGGSLLVVWTMCLWTSLALGVYRHTATPDCRHATHWLMLGAIIIVLLPLTVGALLGTASVRWRVATGLTIFYLLLPLLKHHARAGTGAHDNKNRFVMQWDDDITATNHSRAGQSWRHGMIRRPVAMLLACSVLAAIAGAHVPEPRLTLRDHYDPPISLRDYASPLSGMRAYIARHRDDVMLTAKGLPPGTAVRIATMDMFDGNVWNLSDSYDGASHSEYLRMPPVSTGTGVDARETPTDSVPFTATFVVGATFGDVWLPTAGAVHGITVMNDAVVARRRVQSESDTAGDGPVLYNAKTGAALLPTGLRPGLIYRQTGVLAVEPETQAIAKASAAQDGTPGLAEIPQSVEQLASRTVQSHNADGQAAQALARILQQGWFSHGTEDEYPSSPGHGSKRLDELASADLMVGDDEQYASLMAVMARWIGLPSRVVLGFLPKDADGMIDKSRTTTGDDGTTIVRFTGNDIAAWVEIKLTNLGWVMFRPSPKESRVADRTMIAAQRYRPVNRRPSMPLGDPPRDEIIPQGSSSVLGGTDASRDKPSASTRSRLDMVVSGMALYGSPIWLLSLWSLALFGVTMLMFAIIRIRGSPRQRVLAGWLAIRVQAVRCGLPRHRLDGSLTRTEQVRAMADHFHGDAALISELEALARRTDHLVFAGRRVEHRQASEYWQMAMKARRRIRSASSRRRRMLAVMSIRGLPDLCMAACRCIPRRRPYKH